jgi:hypothetical protein
MHQVAAAASEALRQNPPSPSSRPGEGFRRVHAEMRKIVAHKLRCREAGRPSDAEMARMVEEFFARGGQVTRVATGHASPIQNGAGRDADRWVP